MSIESIKAPKMMKPGEVSEVEVNLQNLAVSFIKDVKATSAADFVKIVEEELLSPAISDQDGRIILADPNS